MTVGVKFQPEALRSIDSATFTGSYQALGIPLVNPGVLVKFVNNSTVLVTVSWDGSTDHDIFPGTSFSVYDVTTNSQTEDGINIPAGTQFYVKGAAGTGFFYLVDFYVK